MSNGGGAYVPNACLCYLCKRRTYLHIAAEGLRPQLNVQPLARLAVCRG